MYKIDQPEYSPEFLAACDAARDHVARMGMESIRWIGGPGTGTLAEHFSFGLGNQVFFVFVAVDGLMSFTGAGRNLFLKSCQSANATACVMEMRRTHAGFLPAGLGWGFEDPDSGASIDPAALVSDALVEMSDWDVHDMAVQVVRAKIAQDGGRVTAWQSDRLIDPSIWFESADGAVSWAVVRGVRHPAGKPPVPDDIEDIKNTVPIESARGYFCGVRVANADDPFDRDGANALPLYRGHALAIGFGGFEPL